MQIKLGLACLLLAATVAVVTADECDFTNNPFSPFWGGERTAAMACFEAIPARPGENANTIEAVRRVFQGHSFSDIVRANLAPYHINVDWAAELDRIQSTNYTSDYSFHNDLNILFNSMLDAHLLYIKPAGYIAMRFNFPFSIVSRYQGGRQKFFAAPGPLMEETWDTTCECQANLPQYYGSEITEIDGKPALEWLITFAKDGGLYADTGAQLNNLLNALQNGFSLGLYKAPASDSITYQFNGTTTATFKYNFQYWSVSSSIADVEGYNHDVSDRGVDSRRSDGVGQNGIAQAEQTTIRQLEEIIRSKLSARDPTSRRLLKLVQQHVETLKQTQSASATFGAKLNEASKKRHFNMDHFLTSHRVPLAHERLRAIDSAIVAGMDLLAGVDRAAAYTATLRKIDAYLSGEQSVGASLKKSAASATETPLGTGDSKLLTVLTEYSGATVAIYDDSIVLRLRHFESDEILTALRHVHILRSTRNIERLIIDVSGNGGGYIHLNYVSLSYLVEQWRNHSTHGNDVLYSPYDWRITPLSDVFWYQDRNEFFGGEVNISTGIPLENSVRDEPRSVTFGGHTSLYSQQYNWDLAPAKFFLNEPVEQTRAFEKIILVTDGTCGSSCAYFLSQLRSTNKVRVVSYGGADGYPLATSSFAGGNVYLYDYVVGAAIKGGYARAANLTYMDHNAMTSFNFRTNYHPGNLTIPRQFIRDEADWHVSYWDPLDIDIGSSSETKRQIMANLYASVTPLFQQMPANLARIDLPPRTAFSSASGVFPTLAASALLVLLTIIF